MQFCTKKAKDDAPMFVLRSIVYDQPQKETGYYYQTHIVRMFATDNLNNYDAQGINLVDSVHFEYNDKHSLSKITVFRKNTTETDEIIYDATGQIIQCVKKSSKKDTYNPDAVITYVRTGNNIKVSNKEESNTYESELLIDKNGLLLSCSDEEFTNKYKYGKNDNLQQIERTEKLTGSKVVIPFEYSLPKNNAFNYGNTPQWFCAVYPNLWTLGTHLTGFKKTDEYNNLMPVSVVSYTSDFDGNPQKVTERILPKGAEPRDVSYQLRYTRVR